MKKLFDTDDPEEDFYSWLEESIPGGQVFGRQGIAGLAGVDIGGSLGIELPSLTQSVPASCQAEI